MDQCFIKACKRPAANATRGLCMLCYKAAKAKVTAGEVTWDRLGELGLCQNINNPFNEAFDEAVRKEIK